MTGRLQRFVLLCLAVFSVSACSGGGSSRAGSTLPPAPALSATAGTVSVQSASSGEITIAGVVLGHASAPSPHTLVDVDGHQVNVYSSFLTEARAGDHVTATGYFNSRHNFQAVSAQDTGASGGSAPTPPAGVPPIGGAPSGPAGTISLFQIFDFAMSASAAEAAAPHLASVWGAGIGNAGADAPAWRSANGRLVAAQYFVQPTDHRAISGHDLAWWQANHPDWIVYDCDERNRPTRTVAYQPGLPQDVPLDISNPQVVEYQVRTAASFALAHGANAIGADQTLFFDYDGNQHGGWYGCGVYSRGGAFERRWGAARGGFPNYDPKWNADVARWAQTAKRVLRSDGAYAGLALLVNHPAGNIYDRNEQTLLANVDGVLDETGFVGYGSYVRNRGLFKLALDYMEFTQHLGTHIYEVAKFSGSTSGGYGRGSLSLEQISYALASYLIGNDGRASLFITPGPYGEAYNYPQVAEVNARLGRACGSFEELAGGRAYVRRFTGGMAAVNPGGGAVDVPVRGSYVDLAGRRWNRAVQLSGADGAVLFTNGNGCR